jgi:hypothetical protein
MSDQSKSNQCRQLFKVVSEPRALVPVRSIFFVELSRCAAGGKKISVHGLVD